MLEKFLEIHILVKFISASVSKKEKTTKLRKFFHMNLDKLVKLYGAKA